MEGTAISTKLFVGNLNYTTKTDELQRLFSQAGEVRSVVIPMDRETGRPRGFCFVEMATADGAATAIARFSGYEVDGRALRVNEAQERRRDDRPRPPGGGYGDRPAGGGYGDRAARPSYGERPAGGGPSDRPPSGGFDDRPARPDFGERPARPEGERPPRGDSGRPGRSDFDKERPPRSGYGERAPRRFDDSEWRGQQPLTEEASPDLWEGGGDDSGGGGGKSRRNARRSKRSL
jgi:RNA recognition motif-containing protein